MVMGPRLVKKFAAFCGTRTFIIMLTRSHHLSVLSQMNPVCAISSCFCKICFNPLNPELNPICYLLALLALHFLHVSRIRVKSLTLRLLMSYIYIYIYIYIYDISNLRVNTALLSSSVRISYALWSVSEEWNQENISENSGTYFVVLAVCVFVLMFK